MREQCEYLMTLATVTGNGDTSLIKDSVAKSERAILEAVALSDSIDVGTGSTCLKFLSDCIPLSLESRINISKAVHVKIGNVKQNQSVRTRQSNQTFLYAHRFFGKKHWDVLEDPNASWPMKLKILVTFLGDSGCVFPDENTITHLIAATILACNKSETLTFSPNDAYLKAQDLRLQCLPTAQERPRGY